MLQSMREKTQSIFAYIIIGLLILSFGLWGISSYFQGNASSNTVAKVDGHKISLRQFSSAYNQLRRYQQTNLGASYSTKAALQKELKQQALESLVQETYLYQNAYDLGYRVDQSELDDVLYAIPAFSSNGRFDPAKFRRYLSLRGIRAETFFQQLRTSLLIQQVQTGVVMSDFVLPAELKAMVSLLNQQRQLRYYLIPANAMNISSIAIKQGQIQNYYDAHQQQYKVPAQLKIAYLHLSLDIIKEHIQISASEAKDYYQQHQQQFIQPQSWQLMIITLPSATADEELQAAKAALASASTDAIQAFNQQYNQSIDLKPQEILASNINTEMKQALSSATANQVVGPLTISGQLVLFKVVSAKAEKQLSFTQVHEKIENSLKTEQAKKAYNVQLDKLTNISYEQPSSLDTAAKATSLAIKTSSFFSKDVEGQGVASHPLIRQAAFSDDVLLGHNNSDVIQVAEDDVYVVRVIEQHAAKTRPLAEVKTTIKKQLQTQQQGQQLEHYAQAIKHALDTKASNLNTLINKYAVTSHKSDYVGRFKKQNISEAVVSAGFSTPTNDHGTSATSTVVSLGLDKGYAVVQVLGVKDGTLTSLQHDEQQSMREKMMQLYGSLAYQGYVDSVKTHAKIKRYPAVMERG
jgi:peptidyl-prolyl cis-trans isomerase D